MKKIVLLIIFSCFLSCSTTNDGNTLLPNVTVNEQIILSNPSNNALRFPGGYVTISGGIAGIIVYNLNDNQYFAYDRACPHKAPQDCAPMVVNDGITMECPCDNAKFVLALGGQPQSGTQFSARQYRVVKQGGILYITNF